MTAIPLVIGTALCGVFLVALAWAYTAATPTTLQFAALAVTAVASVGSLGCVWARTRARELQSHREAQHEHRLRIELETGLEERLHELRSTVLAVAGGVHVLDTVRGGRNATLARALEAELRRLQDLIAPDTEGEAACARFIIADALTPTLRVCAAAGWPVRWTLPSRLGAWGRPADLAQIVHELVANARRHAPGSPIEVEAEARGVEVLVRVRDRGPGIPPAQDELIFESGARGRTSDGRGLGLSIARRLARAQGGDLRIGNHSDRGGADFVINLPALPVGLARKLDLDAHRQSA